MIKSEIAILGNKKVLVSSLSQGSNATVECVCDICSQEYRQRFCRNTDVCAKCRSRQNMLNNTFGSKNLKYNILTKEELYKLHYENELSIEDIRKQFNVSRPVIARLFKQYDFIPINHLKRLETTIPTKKELEELYIIKKTTIKDIAKLYSTGSIKVNEWLKKYQIAKQTNRKKRKFMPDQQTLIDLNQKQKMTLKDISAKYNVSDVLVGLWFSEYQIPIQINVKGVSDSEKIITKELNDLGFNFYKTKQILKNKKELDLYDDTAKFAIEYCGLYWHSEEKIGKVYHLDKLQECSSLGIQLITIFEDEWLTKKDIVLSILKSKLNINKTLYARETKFVTISNQLCREFLKENHLQGSPQNIDKCFGLKTKEDKLVGVISYGYHHRDKSKYVLNRLCFLKNITVIGGSKKLFVNSLERIPKTEIISWSDKRWSNGNVYKQLGFTLKETLSPDYSYFKNQTRYSKQSMKKSNVGCPKNITEREWNLSRGFGIIWDCGKDVWIYNNTK